ncbi:MAG: hypothetical protein PHY29_08345 [Syntrophales bacterium]|jgi:hypothetical protein|nr:hypothetical protein [Syntrophales bacterium]
MSKTIHNQALPGGASRFGWLKLLVIVAVATTVATIIAVWATTHYIFPKELRPVTLSPGEERALDVKLERMHLPHKGDTSSQQRPESTWETPLEPERYSEDAGGREIAFSEKELNALLANNTNLAKKLAIDLDDDMVSMKLLVPLEEGLPLFGGKTLKVTAGLELAYAGGKPVVAFKGVSLWGVPLPNAWLGNLKNVDLVKEFGAEEGFWNSFAAGVDNVKVEKGSLRVRLKE